MSLSLESKTLNVLSPDGARTVLEVLIPKSFLARARGLLGRERLGLSRGMLFERCASVHCFGMTRPIDVVFASRAGDILKCVPLLQPYRLALCLGAYYVLELDAGGIAELGIGLSGRFELAEK
jgi:uncharacterized protein